MLSRISVLGSQKKQIRTPSRVSVPMSYALRTKARPCAELTAKMASPLDCALRTSALPPRRAYSTRIPSEPAPVSERAAVSSRKVLRVGADGGKEGYWRGRADEEAEVGVGCMTKEI